MTFNLSYIKYLFQSTNQHGVHSPFVYALITKSLYKNYKLVEHPLLSSWKIHHSFNNRKQKIINGALFYFNDENFKMNHDNDFRSEKTTYVNLKKSNPDALLEKIPTSSFYIIDNIHASEKHINQWKKLKVSENFSISIDFYDMGFLFIRRKQIKEDFKIRI